MFWSQFGLGLDFSDVITVLCLKHDHTYTTIVIDCFICSVVAPVAASDNELRLFHSTEYLECLRHLSQLDGSEKSLDNLEEFGLGK